VRASDWMQIFLLGGLGVALTPPLGAFMARVYRGERHLFSRALGWLERLSYRAGGVDPEEGMDWKRYCAALLWFNAFGAAAVFLLQMAQKHLPLNPQHLAAPSWDSAFSTAVSFMTNTNWQSYAPETTLSFLTSMLGLATQNFVSAATGMAVMAALARGLKARQARSLGNFWADLVRTTVYILLPLAFVFALFLCGQGVVQNFRPYDAVKPLDGGGQLLPQGPAASQIAIKQLGTNGGGFFNANSAYPFENPTPLSDFFEMLAVLLIPSACVWTFGLLVDDRRHAMTLWGAMFVLYAMGLGTMLWAEYSPNPVFHQAAMMEGKEQRFGVVNSVLWAQSTTVTSNGSVNCMHDSLSPLAGMVCMLNILVGEVVYGGVGCGVYGMVVFVILTVFMAGLMVGRTPEYLGKKIDGKDVKLVVAAILLPNAAIKIGIAIACVLPSALACLNNAGPHGFSELIYAYASAVGNNGSAFAGLNADTPFFNVSQGLCMLIGRFAVLIPVLAIAGNMAAKRYAAPSAGTFSTDNGLFLCLLVAVILIMGVLAFFPALCLGPIVEHFLMLAGRTF
jgi:potassium-transporting ATPase potassium-binding subunit